MFSRNMKANHVPVDGPTSMHIHSNLGGDSEGELGGNGILDQSTRICEI